MREWTAWRNQSEEEGSRPSVSLKNMENCIVLEKMMQ